jgi:hypothetical protein
MALRAIEAPFLFLRKIFSNEQKVLLLNFHQKERRHPDGKIAKQSKKR